MPLSGTSCREYVALRGVTDYMRSKWDEVQFPGFFRNQMKEQTMERLWLGVFCAAGLLCGGLTGMACPQVNATNNTSTDTNASVIPRWNVGDQWTVETASRPLQARGDTDAGARELVRTQWRFTVTGKEKLAGRDALRIDVRCLDQSVRRPGVTIRVDAERGVLLQVQAEIPAADGFRTLTESYAFEGNQVSPVMGPLTALPIDLPVLGSGNVKSVGSFHYQAIAGARGAKAVGDVQFTFSVQQAVQRASQKQVKSLAHKSLVKSLVDEPMLEVRLKGFNRNVRQLWQRDLPWPVYSTNGSTESRLLKVQRAADHREGATNDD